MATMTPASQEITLQSASRVLAALDALGRHPEGATPKTVSADLGLHLSTTYHLLNTLVASGYAIREPTSRLFRLGPRIPLLYDILLGAVRPAPRLRAFVQAAQQATGETIQLWRWWGDDVIAAEVVEGTRPGHLPASPIGVPCAPHLLAVGKVLLAWASDEQVAACLARPELSRHPGLPAPEPLALRDELECIRRQGYAIDRGSIFPTVCCVAAPVMREDGAIGHALSALVPRERFSRDLPALIETMTGIARAAGATGAEVSREAEVQMQREEAWRAINRRRCPRQAALRPHRPQNGAVRRGARNTGSDDGLVVPEVAGVPA